MSICFAEFENPTWNCRGICPLDGRARCITGVSSWKPGSFAFFTLLRDEPPPPSAFAPIEWKASVVTHPATLSIFFYLRTTVPFPPFISLGTTYSRMPILNLLPYAIFTENLFWFLSDLLTVTRPSFLNLGINLLLFFFSFVFFFLSLRFLRNFNVMMYNIFLYFEISNLEEEIVKWFASNNIILRK